MAAMALDTLQFVDSIATSPTVRLNLNDGLKWTFTALDFTPPPLKKAYAGTLLADGEQIPAWAYANRLLQMALNLICDTTDEAATAIQLLNRELARQGNIIKWQPAGATNPVFFRTFPESPQSIRNPTGANNIAVVRLEVEADPFAYGTREVYTAVTVTNDPAVGGGMLANFTDVKGDVDTPMIIQNRTGVRPFGCLAVAYDSASSGGVAPFVQSESYAGFGADTGNVGGGPDAAMSGTATNNYVRTSFAGTPGWAYRLVSSASATDRRFVCVRRSDNTSVIKLRLRFADASFRTLGYGKEVTLPLSTSRMIVDLGLAGTALVHKGRLAPESATYTRVYIEATRTSGAGTLDWDFEFMMPATESLLTWFTSDANDATVDMVIDGELEQLYVVNDEPSPDLFYSSVVVYPYAWAVSGGFPKLRPGATNSLFFFHSTSSTDPGVTHVVTQTNSLRVYYWPRYLYVKPSST